MSWINWSDVDKFAWGIGLSEQEAHTANQDPTIQEKRKEFQEEFEFYRDHLYTLLWSKDTNKIPTALLETPDDVLVAFFGVAGLFVVETKAELTIRSN